MSDSRITVHIQFMTVLTELKKVPGGTKVFV